LEGKTTILVGVEETDKAVSLALRGGEVALVSEEVEHLQGADKGVAVSVKSLESRVGSEVADRAEALASSLKTSFSVANGNKQLLESAFRFESKGHDVYIRKGGSVHSFSQEQGGGSSQKVRTSARTYDLFGKLN